MKVRTHVLRRQQVALALADLGPTSIAELARAIGSTQVSVRNTLVSLPWFARCPYVVGNGPQLWRITSIGVDVIQSGFKLPQRTERLTPHTRRPKRPKLVVPNYPKRPEGARRAGHGLLAGCSTSTALRLFTASGHVIGTWWPEFECPAGGVGLESTPLTPAANQAFDQSELADRLEKYAARAAEQLPLFA